MAISPAGMNVPFKKNMMYYVQQNVYATCAEVRRLAIFKNCMKEMGEDRVLFSVDHPFESNEDAADRFDGLELNENTRCAIGFENAKRLLRLP
jgi:gamma-resorcylate decarboxylase